MEPKPSNLALVRPGKVGWQPKDRSNDRLLLHLPTLHFSSSPSSPSSSSSSSSLTAITSPACGNSRTKFKVPAVARETIPYLLGNYVKSLDWQNGSRIYPTSSMDPIALRPRRPQYTKYSCTSSSTTIYSTSTSATIATYSRP